MRHTDSCDVGGAVVHLEHSGDRYVRSAQTACIWFKKNSFLHRVLSTPIAQARYPDLDQAWRFSCGEYAREAPEKRA